jgi:hypothetical protein
MSWTRRVRRCHARGLMHCEGAPSTQAALLLCRGLTGVVVADVHHFGGASFLTCEDGVTGLVFAGFFFLYAAQESF